MIRYEWNNTGQCPELLSGWFLHHRLPYFMLCMLNYVISTHINRLLIMIWYITMICIYIYCIYYSHMMRHMIYQYIMIERAIMTSHDLTRAEGRPCGSSLRGVKRWWERHFGGFSKAGLIVCWCRTLISRYIMQLSCYIPIDIPWNHMTSPFLAGKPLRSKQWNYWMWHDKDKVFVLAHDDSECPVAG